MHSERDRTNPKVMIFQTGPRRCPRCYGQGAFLRWFSTTGGNKVRPVSCDRCSGTGTIWPGATTI